MSTIERKVLLLFSGGLDSSATAIKYLLAGHPLEMVTFDNGAQRDLHLSRRKAQKIIRRFPNKAQHRILDCRDLFQQVAIKTLEDDISCYGNLVCCGCKMVMLAKAIVFCREHRIPILADGYRKEQNYYPEQTPEFMSIADHLASRMGVDYQHPLYETSHGQLRALTLNGGLRFRAQQASCLFGENKMRGKGPQIARYTNAKLSMIESWLKSNLLSDCRPKKSLPDSAKRHTNMSTWCGPRYP